MLELLEELGCGQMPWFQGSLAEAVKKNISNMDLDGKVFQILHVNIGFEKIAPI